MSLSLDSDLESLERSVRERLPALITEAARSAVTRRWAVGAPLPHRLEPHLHERVWVRRGGFVEDQGEELYGFDADGRVVAVRINADRVEPGTHQAGEIVLRAPGTVVIVMYYAEFPRGHPAELQRLIRHTLQDGRIVRTEYSDGGEERYHYDGDRLVAIDEHREIDWTTRLPAWRWQHDFAGGRVDVRDGVLWKDGQVLYRPAPPFEQLLAERVPGYADAVVEAITAWDEREPERPVDTLWLDTYTQHGPNGLIYVGFTDRPERWPFEDGPGAWVVFDDEQEQTLLRSGAFAVEDPVVEVCDAVGRRLRAHDWRGVLNPTDDFVVIMCPGDEDHEPSLRRLNPPERADRWLRRAADGQR